MEQSKEKVNEKVNEKSKEINNTAVLNNLIDNVSKDLYELLKDTTIDQGESKDDYERKNNEKIELQMALKECIFQDEVSKKIVLRKIKNMLLDKYEINSANICEIIHFNDINLLSPDLMFSILLNKFKKAYGKEALEKLIDIYHLDNLKNVDGEERYVITKEEIKSCYLCEICNKSYELSFDDMMDILVQFIYSRYKGYGVIDEILDMDIDGINGGVNGVPEILTSKCDVKSYDSIWIIFKGKSIHLKFLSFGSYEELRRVCQNIYRFDCPGELSKASGYKINKLKDGSRVVVIRPDFGETWMFFVRKFRVSKMKLEDVICGENKDKVISILKYIMKGCQTTCISGQQGSGKTTMLLNMVEYLYPVYPIRVCETSFELNLRSRFLNRNICTIQEIDTINGQEALDILKKTDGLINVIGEVASDDVASQLMQSGQVASKCTIFTHHAKSSQNLLKALRNSLLKTGVFKNENIAEEQVASVIKFDVHMEKDFYGNRYIERITEWIEKDHGVDFVDIVVHEKDGYVIKNIFSNEVCIAMKKEMKESDIIEFQRFVDKEMIDEINEESKNKNEIENSK